MRRKRAILQIVRGKARCETQSNTKRMGENGSAEAHPPEELGGTDCTGRGDSTEDLDCPWFADSPNWPYCTEEKDHDDCNSFAELRAYLFCPG